MFDPAVPLQSSSPLDTQAKFNQMNIRQDSLFGAINSQVPNMTPPPYQPPHNPHLLGHLDGVVPQGGVDPANYIQTQGGLQSSRLATHV